MGTVEARLRGAALVVAVVAALVVSACTDSVTDRTDAGAGTTTTDGGTTTTGAGAETTTTAAGTTTTGAVTPPDGSGCGLTLTPGQTTVSLEFEDRTRVYELVVPAGYDPAVPTPVVLNWHGLGSNGPDQLAFSEYPALADREGFLVVAPTGVPMPGQALNSWELTDDDDPTRDDLAFAAAVLDHVIATTCVDEARVYTTGMSNGGYFSSRLVCEMSDRIAAAASVAGLTHPDDCLPSRPVPYLGFHGVLDEIVPYDGGGFSSLFPGVRVELFEAVIPDEFAEFATGDGCGPVPVEQAVTGNVTTFIYPACPEGVEAVFYRIADGGHTWPGSASSAAISEPAGLGRTNTEINATELSWEFFSRHPLG
ncbi:MAG: alpha/beta hydrolase family esterase [Acidimicrobiales bacterium]